MVVGKAILERGFVKLNLIFAQPLTHFCSMAEEADISDISRASLACLEENTQAKLDEGFTSSQPINV